MKIKTINTEVVNFLLSIRCTEALFFAICSCSLKTGHDHTFKAMGLGLLRCESTCLTMENVLRIKTGWHRLTHRVEL